MRPNRRLISAVVLTALASITLTFASRFNFYLFALIALVTVPSFIFTSLISLILLITAKAKKRENLTYWARQIGIVSLLSIILGLTIPGSFYLWQYDQKASTTFCESLIPKLEDYKMRHGNYPSDIEKLQLKNQIPRLLTKYKYYSSHAQYFRFKIVNIGPQAYWMVYDSRKKIWEGYDPIAEGFEF